MSAAVESIASLPLKEKEAVLVLQALGQDNRWPKWIHKIEDINRCHFIKNLQGVFALEGVVSRVEELPFPSDRGLACRIQSCWEQSKREEMQDTHLIMVEKEGVFLGVFDGHSPQGKTIAEIAKTTFEECFFPFLQENREKNIQAVFQKVVQRAHEESESFIRRNEGNGGSALACCYIERKSNIAYVCNLGDCEVKLLRKDKEEDRLSIFPLSVIHNWGQAEERRRALIFFAQKLQDITTAYNKKVETIENSTPDPLVRQDAIKSLRNLFKKAKGEIDFEHQRVKRAEREQLSPHHKYTPRVRVSGRNFSRAIGNVGHPVILQKVEMTAIPLVPGDRVLCFSDGFCLSDGQIVASLLKGKGEADELVAAALDTQETVQYWDNITLITCDIVEEKENELD